MGEGGYAGAGLGAGSVPQARRLIEAGDHAAAMKLLEDALIEARPGDRPAILDLLRQSYEVLARKAEASGRAREAAHYRDNLAILEQVREPARPVPAHPEPPARSKAAPARAKAAEGPRSPTPSSRPATAAPSPAPSPPPTLLEPAPLPEPEKLPPPAPPRARAAPPSKSDGRPEPEHPIPSISPPSPTPPGRAAGRAGSVPRTTRIPDIGLPMVADPAADRDSAHGSRPGLAAEPTPEQEPAGDADANINPGSATPEAKPDRTADGNPGAASDADGAAAPGRPATDSELDRADHLFAAKQYDEAGRVYASLAGQDRLPPDRRPHWAYCRAKEVCRQINAHPRSTGEWDAIEAEVRAIQQLTPGNWVGEYLRRLVAEGRRGRSTTGGPVEQADRPRLGTRGGPGTPPPGAGALRQGSRSREPAAQGRTGAPAGRPRPGTGPETPRGHAGQEPLLALNDAPGPGIGIESPTPTPASGLPPVVLAEEGTPKPRGDEPAASAPVEWQVHETTNFRVFHCDLTLAKRAAEVAESVRTAQAKRWIGPSTRRTGRRDATCISTRPPAPMPRRPASPRSRPASRPWRTTGPGRLPPHEPPRRQPDAADRHLAARGHPHRPGRRVRGPADPAMGR